MKLCIIAISLCVATPAWSTIVLRIIPPAVEFVAVPASANDAEASQFRKAQDAFDNAQLKTALKRYSQLKTSARFGAVAQYMMARTLYRLDKEKAAAQIFANLLKNPKTLRQVRSASAEFLTALLVDQIKESTGKPYTIRRRADGKKVIVLNDITMRIPAADVIKQIRQAIPATARHARYRLFSLAAALVFDFARYKDCIVFIDHAVRHAPGQLQTRLLSLKVAALRRLRKPAEAARLAQFLAVLTKSQSVPPPPQPADEYALTGGQFRVGVPTHFFRHVRRVARTCLSRGNHRKPVPVSLVLRSGPKQPRTVAASALAACMRKSLLHVFSQRSPTDEIRDHHIRVTGI